MEQIISTSKDYDIFHKYITNNVVKCQKKVFIVGPATSHEVFSSLSYEEQVVCFLCTENMRRRDFQIQRSHMPKSHIIITGSPEQDVPQDYKGKVFVLPAYFMWIDFTKENIRYAIKSNVKHSLNNRNGICFVARDDVGKNRKRMLRYFRNNNIHIDCPSKIGNNCPSIESRNISKNEFLQSYIFNLCPENIYNEGYVTEKIFDACISGCIPLYFGGGINHIEKIINMDRVILTRTGFKSHYYGDMLEKINFLQNNEELEKFFYQPVFQENASDEILKLFEKVTEITKYFCEI